MKNTFELIVSKAVFKQLFEVPLPWRERIIKAIDQLPQYPFVGEKLYGKLKVKRKLKVYPYRVIYLVDEINGVIILIEAGRRGSIF